jgi:hypothetical protein
MKKLMSEKRLKQAATALKKSLGIKQSEALSIVSSEYGFESWELLKKYLDTGAILEKRIPDASLIFVEDDDVHMDDEDYTIYDEERDGDLAPAIKMLVEKNRKALVAAGVEFSVFEPTKTGFRKSILDATQPVRIHFELIAFHNYTSQQKGPEHKVVKCAWFLTPEEKIQSKVSLYRPVTKSGDPRMWFSGLSQIADAGDQVAIVILDDSAFLLNLSKLDLDTVLASKGNQVESFLSLYQSKIASVSDELLGRLRELAKAPFPSQRSGSTGLGYTLEKLLGIEANSSKLPDYHGIELKAGRGSLNRTTLFAQVADWNISTCKSSAEILDSYGYQREGHIKLYCTISALKPNSQGLSFFYEAKTDQLQELHNNATVVAIWPGLVLRKRLLEKHAETFWVDAESTFIDGIEHFQLKSVTHTRAPIVSQLIPLITSGAITMDHLIKRNEETNKVTEKGPLFKIHKRDLELLFPKPVKYKLLPENN